MIFVTEAPDHRLTWKSFCKLPYDLEQIVSIFRQLTAGLKAIHEKGIIFRDLHPTRIHLNNGVIKWNLVGMPYNFKKLLKSATFTGHLNYTAPEILQIGPYNMLTDKADIWALGCCLYYVATKRDPYNCENPKNNTDFIKQNIRMGRIDMPNDLNLDW
jgi:serine/threonine protein kinase